MKHTERTKIIEWLYLNDGNYASKQEWRKEFLSFLEGLTDEVALLATDSSSCNIQKQPALSDEDLEDHVKNILRQNKSLVTCKRELTNLMKAHTSHSQPEIRKIVQKIIDNHSLSQETGFEKISGSKKADPYLTY